MSSKQSRRHDPCSCGSGKPFGECCRRAVKRDVRRHYEMARHFMTNMNLGRAEVLFREILDLSPDHADARHMFALIRHRQGQKEEAVTLLKEAIRFAPGNTDMCFDCGAILYELGKMKKAAKYYFKAIGTDPGFFPARQNISYMIIKEDFLPDADWLKSKKSGKEHHIPASPGLIALINLLDEEFRDIGKLAALSNFTQRLPGKVADFVDVICLFLLWGQLVKVGWYDRHPDWPKPVSPRLFCDCFDDPAFQAGFLTIFVGWLQYKAGSPPAWNAMLFKEYFAPATEILMQKGDCFYVKHLNFFSLVAYGMQPHTLEQWEACEGKLMPGVIRAAEDIKKKYPAPRQPAARNPNQKPTIAFISECLINGSPGDVLLMNYLKGWERNQSANLIIYAVAGIDPAWAEAFSSMGIRIVCFQVVQSNSEYVQLMLSLRETMAKDRVTALVYLGISSNGAILDGAFRLAPTQIYFAMTLKPQNLPSWDGFMAGGSSVKSGVWYGNHYWRTTPIPSPDKYPVAGSDEERIFNRELAALRKNWPDRAILLGTIARAEKIDDPEFIGVLARILKANPNAVYLWFGVKELKSLRKRMKEHQISDRCFFMGWVSNVELYAKLLDIHLDSFPFCTGLAGLTTLSAGTPNVWMDTPEARQLAVWINIVPLLEGGMGSEEEQRLARSIYQSDTQGRNLALLAKNEDDYCRYTQQLIDDGDFRAAVGQAGRSFMQHFMHDASRATQVFFEHVADIVRGDGPTRREVANR